MKWRQFIAALSIGIVALSGPVVGQEPEVAAEEPEGEPLVKQLSGEDLPPGFALTTSVVHMVKRAVNDPHRAKLYFEARGLDVTDADLDHLVTLYGDFDERQAERHEQVLREHAEAPEKIRASSERYLMERASLTGGVFGAWLAHLRSKGQDTDRFVVEVATAHNGSAFWSGRAPTLEGIAREASTFESSFQREYGVALPALLAAGANGGGR